MKILNAFTEEVDDNEAAIKELLEQLNYPKAFMSHSLALVSFNSEFIDSGMYEAFQKALPIDMIGCSTTYNGINGKNSEYGFSVLVMTGDDIEFQTSVTKEIEKQDTKEAIKDKIADAARTADRDAVALFVYCGVFGRLGGDDLVDAIDETMGGQVPLFGTIAWNGEDSANCSYVVCNEAVSTKIVALVSIKGNCKPRFIQTSSLIGRGTDLRFSGMITECDDTLLKSINNMPAIKYLEEKNAFNQNEDMWVLPAIMKITETTYIGRSFLGNYDNLKTDEGIMSTGRLQEGAEIEFSFLDRENVVDSAAKAFTEFKKSNIDCTISFSCIARSWALGSQSDAEFKAIDKVARDQSPYLLSYAGGEICPIYLEDGAIKNVFHNYTLISCVLES